MFKGYKTLERREGHGDLVDGVEHGSVGGRGAGDAGREAAVETLQATLRPQLLRRKSGDLRHTASVQIPGPEIALEPDSAMHAVLQCDGRRLNGQKLISKAGETLCTWAVVRKLGYFRFAGSSSSVMIADLITSIG